MFSVIPLSGISELSFDSAVLELFVGVAGRKLYVLDEFVVVVGLCSMSLWM